MAHSTISAILAIVVLAAAATTSCERAVPARGGEDSSAGARDGATDPTGYEAAIRQFQHEREALLTTDTGWLTIAGLFFLGPSQTTFGSDPLNDIVLPRDAPPRAGTFEVHAGTVRVTAVPGVTFRLGDRSVTSAELKSDATGTPDRIGLGALEMWVHMSGQRLSIRLRDRNSERRKQFAGLSWFPIDETYKVEAQYVPYDTPRMMQIPNLLGDIDLMPVPGEVTFSLKGQPVKMMAVAEPGDKMFWFIFRDLTSGQETYPAARFLYAPAPENGKLVLDFNKAQNPPCAYNPYTTCPLPPEQNRLRVRVEAGEKTYAGHS